VGDKRRSSPKPRVRGSKKFISKSGKRLEFEVGGGILRVSIVDPVRRAYPMVMKVEEKEEPRRN